MSCDLDHALHRSVLKREEARERAYREERAKLDEEVHLGFGATEMTKAELRKIIDSDRRMYYRTEELNDKLYIHYKGWKRIQNLEGWTDLRSLYAECNAFSQIEGLQCCRNLRSLFLQENCIKRIEGLECCVELRNLNLSNNFISRIEGLSKLEKLQTLTITKNRIGLQGVDDVIELVDSPVTTLDLQDNRNWDPDIVPEVFMRMLDLRVLYLKGNPCTSKIPNYRKGITAYCKDLRYLDDRPVFPEDRRTAEAFNRGGLEEERAERRRIKQEEKDKHDRNMKAFSEMVENAKREKRERDAMRKEDKFTDDTDPVDTLEKRMKRQVDQWREEHWDEIKDDAKERAQRMLAAEREQAGAEECASQAASEEPAQRMPAPEGEQEGAAGAEEGASQAAPEAAGHDSAVSASGQQEPEEKKIIYEDIWDDVPLSAPQQAPAASAKPESARSPESRAPGKPEPEPATSGVFLPWASGGNAVGMDALPPTAGAVEQRREELRMAALEQQKRPLASAEGEAGEPAWYSKYAEKAQAQDPGASQGAQPVPPASPAGAPSVVSVGFPAAPGGNAAGPAKTSTPALPAAETLCNELDEMD